MQKVDSKRIVVVYGANPYGLLIQSVQPHVATRPPVKNVFRRRRTVGGDWYTPDVIDESG